MLTAGYRFLESCADSLDHLRSFALRQTLRASWLRPVFYTRSLRLLCLFAATCALMLNLSLLFPLWVLFIGPLVYGVPHIFSSMRYFHYATGSASKEKMHRILGLIGGILMVVFLYRFFFTLHFFGIQAPQLSEWKGSTYLELISLAATFVIASAVYRKSALKVARGIAFLSPLFVAFYFSPLWTIGAMVLLHNFVAFVYWMIAAQKKSERLVAAVSFAAVLILTAGIFLGWFDGIYRTIHPSLALGFTSLSVADTGRLIAPWSGDATLWLHACVAFAFGQSLHYFVWLKAIPDQFHYCEVPTSFRQSLALLKQDFGKILAVAAIVLSAGSVVLWSFMSFQTARLVYFALAAYHGYLEIAGLGLASLERQGKTEKP
jgi:hypothetical protein